MEDIAEACSGKWNQEMFGAITAAEEPGNDYSGCVSKTGACVFGMRAQATAM